MSKLQCHGRWISRFQMPSLKRFLVPPPILQTSEKAKLKVCCPSGKEMSSLWHHGCTTRLAPAELVSGLSSSSIIDRARWLSPCAHSQAVEPESLITEHSVKPVGVTSDELGNQLRFHDESVSHSPQRRTQFCFFSTISYLSTFLWHSNSGVPIDEEDSPAFCLPF